MYTAYIASLKNVRPHPNADKIQLATACGSQIVVGLDVQEGELGIYFPEDGQLSEEFAQMNDLVRYKDDEGNVKGGFFETNRRVRTQKFRGEKSEGFWCPLSYVQYTGVHVEDLEEGLGLTSLNGKVLCEKYYTPATLRAIKNKENIKTIKRGETPYFPMHIKDTVQLRHVLDSIPFPSVIYITEKLHGTSHRYGHVLDSQMIPLSKWKEYFNKWIFPYFQVRETPLAYTHLSGSRKVILEKTRGNGFYGSHQFRYNVTRDITLKKGEVLYGELVGYVHGSTPIMPFVAIKKSEVKDLIPLYGEKMGFTYGCQENECKFYIYRIIHMGEDGHYVELSWPQVKKRCGELGIPHVPEIVSTPLLYTGDKTELASLSEMLNQGSSLLDPSHMREGLVLRVEGLTGEVSFIKDKSFAFKIVEGIVKSQDDYVDREEVGQA